MDWSGFGRPNQLDPRERGLITRRGEGRGLGGRAFRLSMIVTWS